jgi:hypothetical protein
MANVFFMFLQARGGMFVGEQFAEPSLFRLFTRTGLSLIPDMHHFSSAEDASAKEFPKPVPLL